MSSKDGGPAFPTERMEWSGHPSMGSEVRVTEPGMTLRDWFAGQGLGLFWLSDAEIARLGRGEHPAHEVVARFCYDLADAMLTAREPREGEKP